MLAGLTARLQGLIVGQDALTLERSEIRAQSESEPGIYLQVSTIEIPHTFLECNVNGRHEKRGHQPTSIKRVGSRWDSLAWHTQFSTDLDPEIMDSQAQKDRCC